MFLLNSGRCEYSWISNFSSNRRKAFNLTIASQQSCLILSISVSRLFFYYLCLKFIIRSIRCSLLVWFCYFLGFVFHKPVTFAHKPLINIRFLYFWNVLFNPFRMPSIKIRCFPARYSFMRLKRKNKRISLI